MVKKIQKKPVKSRISKDSDLISHSSDQSRVSMSVVLAGIALGLLLVFVAMRFLYLPGQGQENKTSSPLNITPSIVEVAGPPVPQNQLPHLNQTFNFEAVFDRLRDLDKTVKTDFRKESLRSSLVPLAEIPPLAAQVRALRDDLNRSIITNESRFWIHLVEGRLAQLESERLFQLALAYGRRGLFSKNITESCTRQSEILDAALLFNQTARVGGRAMYHFDMALTQERTWPLLGINEKRMAFFGGDTRDVGSLAYNNVEAVRVKCMGLPRGDAATVEGSELFKD